MQKLPSRKVIAIIRLYLNGWSYGEIAAKVGVSKSTVGNVIDGLKAGRFPEAGDVPEQIELLHDLAADLKQHRMSAGQALAGIAALSRLHETGLEPVDLERLARLCRALPQEADIPSFIKAALALEDTRQHTGLDIDELETKATQLEKAVADLEPLAQQVQEQREQVEELAKQRQRLSIEVEETDIHLKSLVSAVKDKEKRETELSHRVLDLEQRAHDADERLSVVRKDIRTLSGLGLSPDDLSGFVDRLCGVAQRHGIKPEALRSRLLHELEQLEEGLGLESLRKTKQKELARVEQKMANATRQLEALKIATNQVRQEQAALKAVMAEERTYISKEIQAFVRLAQDTVTQLRQHLGDGVREAVGEVQVLRDRALEAGHEVGYCQAIIEFREWLRELVALVSGEEGISGNRVRVIGVRILYGMKAWVSRHQEELGPLSDLKSRIATLIEELERWTP